MNPCEMFGENKEKLVNREPEANDSQTFCLGKSLEKEVLVVKPLFKHNKDLSLAACGVVYEQVNE